MSSAVFPALIGQGWSVTREPLWQTRVQQSISGKETRLADWSYPRWEWGLTYDVLRQGAIGGAVYAEFAQLAGFFNARQGQFDTFLYEDADDNAVAGQAIAIGDGTTSVFQLVRSFGNFIEPILAPNVGANVYLNGVAQTPETAWNMTGWGGTFLIGGGASTEAVGSLNFLTAPASGVSITADFSYYFPCRFGVDNLSFEKFMAALYALKKITFRSVK